VHRPVWADCAEEDECLLFDVLQDPNVPGRCRFVEVCRLGGSSLRMYVNVYFCHVRQGRKGMGNNSLGAGNEG
jgi:hypothetical protein